MHTRVLVAMVATHNRIDLLLQRSLPSVLGQIRRADRIVVVDDGKDQHLPDRLADAAPMAEILENRRTKGLSGALNTGLDHLARDVRDPSRVFVAFLDDDDCWRPDHLAKVEDSIRAGAEVIAAPFFRIEPDRDPRQVNPPTSLCPNEFMACNPGIQGSNLVARLDVLLEAGGFNEALPSCTDRDLLIRLSRRPEVRYATIANATVEHHACDDRPRLSLASSQEKSDGLEMFDLIHGPLMTEGTREAHLRRARELFGWKPDPREASHRSLRASETLAEVETPPLVVGIIVDERRIPSAGRLLDDLANRLEAEGLEPADVLLLENRPEAASGDALTRLVERLRPQLRIRVIDRAAVRTLIQSGDLQLEGDDHDGRLTITDARTVLQSVLYHMARERTGCAIWILDDDMRLDPLVATPEGARPTRLTLGTSLRQMRALGADICIGSYTGAPPLPSVASVRGQLVDLMWNLRRLSALPADSPVPASEPRNGRLREGRRDYYYDLSRMETDRLETPFSLGSAYSAETCGQALNRLAGMIPRILAGEAPLRPLLADAQEMAEFKINDALHRGGNTFIFDPEALADLPNLSPTVGGRPTRRSDMMWSMFQVQDFGRTVRSVPVPVRHDRGDLPAPTELDHKGIADDICGFAIFSAMKDSQEPQEITSRVQKFESERLAALRLSFHRVRGIARELMGWCQSASLSPAQSRAFTSQAQDLLRMFSDESSQEIDHAVRALGPLEIQSFLSRLPERISTHADRVRKSEGIPRLLSEQRACAARDAVIALGHPTAELRLLGQGEEGVALTDGQTLWKLFDRWRPEQAAGAAPVIERLITQGSGSTTLINPTAMSRTAVGWLLEMPFIQSDPWEGGRGPGLVELLDDLHRMKLACRNLHPKNLRIDGDAVRLIDYGADLVPNDDPEADGLEFRRMCRRAWLCWRWWWRGDLNELMRRSLREVDMPELDGHEGLVRAARERLGVCRPLDPTLTRALELRPGRVLDYGAGKGTEATKIAQGGAQVVAWDPDESLSHRLEGLSEHGVHRAVSATEAVSAGPYDLVIFRRVACLLDDNELACALKDLRSSVKPGGRVLFSLCHPAYAHRTRVAEGEPISHPCGCRAAPWRKRSRHTGRILNEVHRSEQQLRRHLARAGLRVVSRYERLCTEFERFETVADLLVLELEPAPLPAVSLLIKACAMDAEALEIHVQDMLSALEGAETFQETILTLDTRIAGFPRQHTTGDLEAVRAAAHRLLDAGDIDRIVETPSEPSALRDLNRRWFGLDVAVAHSAGGAATAALLAGFEACSAPRVLHADLDMMIGRIGPASNPVADLSAVLDKHPDAITASFPVARSIGLAWTSEGPEGPWRVESRLGLVDLQRMFQVLPLPNRLDHDAVQLSWHRALDQAVGEGRGTSLRGGGGGSFCVHPPNFRKRNLDEWEEVRLAVARGNSPAVQEGSIEWTGTLSEWRCPERNERFVFVICGRNVKPERFRRCWDSVLRQNRGDWGAIVVDDASTPSISSEIAHILTPRAESVSFLQRRRRAGQLANVVHSIRHLCARPDQTIITLDADDHLIGDDVLDRLAAEYDSGADFTVGSMLRTDKCSDYSVRLDDPRRHRGGNVWQHLRSFRKSLFESVPDDLLRLDGAYVELASDWAFMLPMAELAQKPVWIREPLYLHEPGDTRDPLRTKAREDVIARLIEPRMNKQEGAG
ncbi:glycosyltransferase [Pseudotabrizicola sediminis]|uniref:Glycosyltransferase n=2 Tax=Pseudotabrizicola sediminis TaxID=2486418 RepID=A0ABY2KL83_9RHOB|nr:glycosyltransferase [Pseudotabrizicola sediminis]